MWEVLQRKYCLLMAPEIYFATELLFPELNGMFWMQIK